jgi:hypothetical protein
LCSYVLHTSFTVFLLLKMMKISVYTILWFVAPCCSVLLQRDDCSAYTKKCDFYFMNLLHHNDCVTFLFRQTEILPLLLGVARCCSESSNTWIFVVYYLFKILFFFYFIIDCMNYGKEIVLLVLLLFLENNLGK